MPPEVSEQELKALREAKEAAEKREAAIRQQAVALQSQVTNYLTAQQQASLNQRPAEQPDPEAFVSNKDLAEWAQGIHQQGQQAQQQSAVMLAKNQRAANRAIFYGARDDAGKPRYRHANRYSSEIDAMLDTLDPMQSAAPGAYEQVYDIIRGRHFEEISGIEFAERQAAERAKQTDDDQYEDVPAEGDETQEAAPPVVPPARQAAQPVERPKRIESPVPSADAVGARPGARRLKSPPATAEEQSAAKRYFDGNVEEFRKWQQGDESVDMFGAKGRTVF